MYNKYTKRKLQTTSAKKQEKYQDSLGVLVPGAAIHQLSGGVSTSNVSSVNCKQQAQESKIYHHHQVVAYIQMLPGTRYAIRTLQRVGMH